MYTFGYMGTKLANTEGVSASGPLNVVLGMVVLLDVLVATIGHAGNLGMYFGYRRFRNNSADPSRPFWFSPLRVLIFWFLKLYHPHCMIVHVCFIPYLFRIC